MIINTTFEWNRNKKEINKVQDYEFLNFINPRHSLSDRDQSLNLHVCIKQT